MTCNHLILDTSQVAFSSGGLTGVTIRCAVTNTQNVDTYSITGDDMLWVEMKFMCYLVSFYNFLSVTCIRNYRVSQALYR